MEGAARNETLNISTSFGVTTATNEVVQGQKRGGVSHQVSPRTIVIPVNFFAAYEALAARLSGLQAGGRIPVYIAPEGEITATINKVTPRRITSPAGTADLLEYDLTLARPGLPMAVQVMVDRTGRLARVVYSDVALAAVREEFATVMAREVRVTRDGDEQSLHSGIGLQHRRHAEPAADEFRAAARGDSGGRTRQAGSRRNTVRRARVRLSRRVRWRMPDTWWCGTTSAASVRAADESSTPASRSMPTTWSPSWRG